MIRCFINRLDIVGLTDFLITLQIWSRLTELATSEDKLKAYLGRQKSTTITHILLEMNGVEMESNLPDDFRKAFESIGTTPAFPIQPKATNAALCIIALKDLLFDEDATETVRSFLLLQTFNRLHQKLCSYGRLDDMAPIILNGYQTLLILAGDLIFNPLIYQLVISQLHRLLEVPALRPLSICLIMYCSKRCLASSKEALMRDHSVFLLYDLDNIMFAAESSKDAALSNLVLKCVEVILSCIDQFSVKADDRGHAIRVACSVLGHTRFKSLLDSFQFEKDHIGSLIELVQLFDPRNPGSGTPFHQLAMMLDEKVADGHQKNLSSLSQTVFALLKNPKVANPETVLGMVLLFAKLPFQAESNSLSLVSEPSTRWSNEHLATIRLLLPYLSGNAESVIMCTTVLGRLLAEPEAAESLNEVDDDSELLAYVSIFKGKKQTIVDLLPSTDDPATLPFKSENYLESEWLCLFTTKLVTKFNFPNFFRLLLPILETGNSDFAAKILPVLFHYKLFKEAETQEPTSTDLSLALVTFLSSPISNPERNLVCFKYILLILKVFCTLIFKG